MSRSCSSYTWTSRRLIVNHTLRCTPVDYTRAWPSAAATVAVVVASTSEAVTMRLSQVLPSWDRHLLSRSGVALVMHHSLDQPPSFVAAKLHLQLSRCGVDLPTHDHHCACTHDGNQAILVRREFAAPAGLRTGEPSADLLRFRPKGFCSAHGMEYVIGTKSFVLQVLTLEVLEYFDFFAKVDVDVFVVQPVDIAAAMRRANAHWLHTFDVDSAKSPQCTGTLAEHLKPYLAGAGCSVTDAPAAHELAATPARAWPTFYSNFVAGWLGLWTSPQVLQYAQYWWAWPGGWRFRWTDQEFWAAALSVTGSWPRVLNLSGWRDSRFVHCDERAMRGRDPRCPELVRSNDPRLAAADGLKALTAGKTTGDLIRMHAQHALKGLGGTSTG